MKSRVVAAILAFAFGFIGAHHFYLGKKDKGMFCVLFCWTSIPAFISLIDFVQLLIMSDSDFDREYNSSQSLLPHQKTTASPLQTTQAQNVTINLGSELQKIHQQAQSASNEKCYIEQIEALSELHKKGILTDEEFTQKKQDLLS